MSDEIRDLMELAPAPPMSIDPHAAVLGGRRRARRRRAGLASVAFTAVAAVTAIALQVSGAPRALAPAGTTPPTPVVPTSGPITEPFPTGSAIVHGEIRHPDGTGVRIALQPRSDGQLVEWAGLLERGEVYDLSKGVRPPLADGDVAWSLGGSHGPRSLRGYVVGVVSSAAVAVASTADADRAVVTLGAVSDGRHTIFDAVMPTDAAFRSVVGLAWTVNGRSAGRLAGEPVPGVDAALVSSGAGDQYVLWRKDRAIGATSGTGSTQGSVTPGQIQAIRSRQDGPLPGRGAFGWVHGTGVLVSSTDPTDRWAVTYGGPVDGRTPFVLVPTSGSLHGTLKISTSSSSVTLTS